MNTQRTNRSIGSEFSWAGLPRGPFLPWAAPAVWYSLGRNALLAAWRQCGASRAIHVPSYFCPDVVAALREAGAPVRIYCDSPLRREPAWETLEPGAGDLVLAVNYFGVRDGAAWRAWQQRHPQVVIVEDHTHDPLSAWARASQAHFAFASLRKTLPAPDGALLWSPRGEALPPAPESSDWTGSALKLAGMIWKQECAGESQASEGRKTQRDFEVQGEAALVHSGGAISPWSHALLQPGYPQALRAARENNVRTFCELFHRELTGNPVVQSLFTDWPTGHCPFNPILLFDAAAGRDEVRSALICEQVYAPIHWPVDRDADAATRALAGRLLTIPLDHRARKEWIPQIVDIIAERVAMLAGSLMKA